MKVHIPDKIDKGTIGEMTGGSGEMGGIVGEMLTDPAKLADFGFGDETINRGRSLKDAASDDHPEYAVVRVEEGWSGSGRLWPASEIDRIVKQTNELEPVGHLGHIPDAEEATSLPDPQTTWIGALAKNEVSTQKDRAGEMVRVAYFAGYLLPGAKIRTYLKTRAVRGISWWGRAHQVPVPGRGVEMREFDLKTIDWARKGSEGMPTSRVLAIASEMKGTDMEVDLAQVTPEQFKAGNPNGYALLVSEVEAAHKTVVGEMEEKITEGDAAKEELGKIRTLLKIDGDKSPLENITALLTRLGTKAKALVEAEVAKLINEKIGEDEDQRALVKRLLPVAEMTDKAADAEDEDAAKKLVGEMVDKAFNEDDVLKTLVGEQQPPVIRRREELNRNAGGSSLETNDYVTPERVQVGG